MDRDDITHAFCRISKRHNCSRHKHKSYPSTPEHRHRHGESPATIDSDQHPRSSVRGWLRGLRRSSSQLSSSPSSSTHTPSKPVRDTSQAETTDLESATTPTPSRHRGGVRTSSPTLLQTHYNLTSGRQPVKDDMAAVASSARAVNGKTHSHQTSFSMLGSSTELHSDQRLNGSSVKSRRISAKHHLSGASATMAETVIALKQRCAVELGANVANTVVSSYNHLVEWISNERLRRLPTEGSAWDKVLAWAQSFAEKFHDFDLAIEQFTGDNFDGAELAFGYCILLLQLGEENASALQTSFGFFFKCSLDLIALLDRVELFNASNDITEQLVLAYADLVTLVSDIALRYYQAIKSTSSEHVSIDIYSSFASTIESFHGRRNRIVDSMWKHRLIDANIEDKSAAGIKNLRSWLAISDQILRTKAGDHTSLVNDRQQLTCLWLQPYITRFLNSSKSELVITGPVGSGKTVLAGTIVDMLQRSNTRRSYTVLFVPISISPRYGLMGFEADLIADGRIQAQATSLYVVQNLLAQLLETRVGSAEVYKALIAAYEQSTYASSLDEYEQILWTALDRVTASTIPGSKETIIVVDGIDEIRAGQQSSQTVLKRLIDSTSKHENVRLISLSQSSSLPSKTHADIEINSDLTYDDIFAVISTLTSKHPLVERRSDIEKDILISHIVTAANGSFLWAKLVTKRLLQEPSPDQFTKAVESLKKNPKPLLDVIREQVTTSNLTEEGKKLLTWLSLAQRPFTLQELRSLLAIDPARGVITDTSVDPLHLLKPITSLVFLQDGLLSIRHSIIRDTVVSLVEQPKQRAFERPTFDLTLRLLAYLKSAVKEQREPTFSTLTQSQVDKVFHQDPLAEYAVRYWTLHFSEVQPSGSEVPQEIWNKLTPVFPTSPTVPLLEKASWNWKPTITQIKWHRISTDCRHRVFKDQHPSILQSIIILAVIFRSISNTEQSSNYFYLASQMSIRIYSKTHPLTTQCLKQFLEVSTTLTSSKRTETMTRREELLVILIESYKAQFGATSELVVSAQTELIELYRSLKEEQKADDLYRAVHGSSTRDIENETVEGKGTTGSLGVRIKGRKIKEVDYNEWNLDYKVDEVYREGTKTVSELIKLAQSYASKGEIARAEQTYFEAWHLSTVQSRTQRTSEAESERVSVALTIANFLKTQKRESEATALVTGVWKEYEASSSLARSEQINTRLFEVGKFLQTMSLSAIALSVFKHCATYMKSVNKQESSSYKEIQEHVQASHREVLKQASSSHQSATHLSESIMTEIEQTVLSSQSKQLDVTSVEAVKSLLTAYVAQHRWKEVTTVSKQALRIVWPTFFVNSAEDVGHPTSNADFAVDLVEQLLTCYKSRRRTFKVQDYRERLFRYLKATRKIDDKAVQHSIEELLKVYDWNKSTDKTIQLWQELLTDYKKAFGPESPQVITTLFKLARLTSPSPSSIEYYRQIVTTLNKDPKVCNPEALEPLVIISEHYWNDRRYQDATWAYTILFQTFISKGKDLKPFQDTNYVSKVYQRLVGSLRETYTDISVIHKYTTEYRKACTTYFGQDSKIAVEATVTLARLCQSTKRYEAEAISLYELLLKDQHAKHYHAEIQSTLDAIYEEQALIAVRTATSSVSSEQASRAVSVIRQRITKTRSQYGWSHEESLDQLKEMSYLYARQSKKEEAVKELTEATSHIISSETSSASLMKSAATVASAFVACSETHRGVEMAEELRWQLITKDTSNAKKYSIDLSKSGQSAAIYVAQLEYSLKQDSSTSFVEVYTTILTEMAYYEEFQRSVRSSQTVETVFKIASRFYSFLTKYQRWSMLNHVQEQLVSYFVRSSGEKAKVGDVAQVKTLVVTMLQYLQTHESRNFLLSVSFASIERVRSLLKSGHQKEACDLAQSAFRYIKASNGYATTLSVKLGLVLALAIAEVDKNTDAPAGSLRHSQLHIAAEIIRQILHSAGQLSMGLAHIPLLQLNGIISILGADKDYVTLEWLLTLLWNSRETHQAWRASTVLAIGRRLTLARYLCGKHEQALHLATDIAYNLRRVHGAANLATLDTNVLLSQICISTGLAFQQQKGAEEIARRYFKRAIGVHESVLRSLSLEPLGLNDEDDMTTLSIEPEPLDLSGFIDDDASQGTYARKHLTLLKLALERYGGYPKGYGEYESINADIFRAYPEELNGVEGLEKWNVKSFGNGKAESNEGTLDTNFSHWALSGPLSLKVNGSVN